MSLPSEGKAYSDSVQVGIMVETPAAAVMTPVLAKYVDFFSIGTNDLVQYTLAVDRGNHNIANLYNHFNPAVLTLVQRTIRLRHVKTGIWAGMRGEMASDPYAAVLLMAMGISELSMSAPSIPRVKESCSVSSIKAKEILADVMKLEDGDEIREYLHKVL